MPVVASDRDRHAGRNVKGLADRLLAGLERVLGERTVVERGLVRDVHRLADQRPVGVVVDERTGMWLQLPDAALAQGRRLRQEGDVVELARDAGAANKPNVVLEALADRHDRRAHALQAVFPANRQLAGVLVRRHVRRVGSRGERVDAEVLEMKMQDAIFNDKTGKTLEAFLDACELDNATLAIHNMFQQAINIGVVRVSPDGYYHRGHNNYRKTKHESISYLMSAGMETELGELRSEVEGRKKKHNAIG